MRGLFIIAILLLSGCEKPQAWYKEGSTQQDFYMDMGQCRAQAFSISQGNLMQTVIVQNGCMQGKGWYLQ